MPSKISLICAGVSAWARMVRVVGAESRLRVRSRSWATSSGMFHSGCHFASGLVGHPGGEALVEPEVVPPLHGDHVAEPLVRHLVGDDGRRRPSVGDGSGLRVEQQVGLAVGDAAEVFHGAGLEVGQGDHVELGHGVLDAEVVCRRSAACTRRLRARSW